jgi:hypothetical protein
MQTGVYGEQDMTAADWLARRRVYDYAEMKATRATLRFELLRYVMHPSRLGRLGLI